MTPELNAPSGWDSYEYRGHRWANIEMQELVYTDLPRGIEDTIRQVIEVPDCRGERIERIERLDPQTLEVVWYDDVDSDSGYSTVHDSTIQNTQRVLSQLWGSNWRVTRKKDERRWDGEHPQRALIRRVEAQRFKYNHEPNDQYKMALHGRPDGVPDDAWRWGDVEGIEQPPEPTGNHDVRDRYIYETSTGTKHILRSNLGGTSVTEGAKTECGLDVDRETLADGSDIRHLAGYVQDYPIHPEDDDPHPEVVFGEDLCSACWRSYQSVSRWSDGSVRSRTPPSDSFSALRSWTLNEDEVDQ